MKPQRDMPAQWDAKLVERGFQYRGVGSARQLAKKAGVSTTAVLRVIYRESPGPEVINAVADALGDRDFVAGWLSIQPIAPRTPPPAEYRRLTPKQQRIVDELIRELAKGESDAGKSDEKSTKLPLTTWEEVDLVADHPSTDTDHTRGGL